MRGIFLSRGEGERPGAAYPEPVPVCGQLSLAVGVARQAQGGLCGRNGGRGMRQPLRCVAGGASEADGWGMRGEAGAGAGPLRDAGRTLYVRRAGGSGAGAAGGAAFLCFSGGFQRQAAGSDLRQTFPEKGCKRLPGQKGAGQGNAGIGEEEHR